VVTGAMTGRRDAASTAAPSALSQQLEKPELSVYPNPTTSDRIDLALQTSSEQTATLQVYDLTGRLVHEETAKLYPGSNPIRLDVKKPLPAGIYQLTVPEYRISSKLVLR